MHISQLRPPARRTLLGLAASLFLLPLGTAAHAQSQTPKPNWQNLDLQTDSVMGISTDRAYRELLPGTKATPVVVAVIDGGIDANHEDLRAVMWRNPNASKGRDHTPSGNGLHGWNYIGGPAGNVWYDNLEVTRLIRALRPKYGPIYSRGDTTGLSPAERDTLTKFRAMLADYRSQLHEAANTLDNITRVEAIADSMVVAIGKPNPTLRDFEQYVPRSNAETQVWQILSSALRHIPDFATFRTEQLERGRRHFQEQLDYYLNFAFDPRAVVGDDSMNPSDRAYGNADVRGPDAEHGTHVAGIIGAVRGNGIGIDGVADAVRIMAVRAVPTGDERDKDIANAIRYAVDNGARVINMSFGKPYSPNKPLVDSAVKYAMSKDVLLVHAAGNDGRDLDAGPQYPSRVYADGSGSAAAWIEVGASSWHDDESLVASFSNYGKTSVDVFAPGVRIRSTVPDSRYLVEDGTSMAAPVVTGLAALIRSRYPALTAVQVKDIIMRSVTKLDYPVVIGEGKDRRRVPFSELCVSGGVVNAYNALKLAATYTASPATM